MLKGKKIFEFKLVTSKKGNISFLTCVLTGTSTFFHMLLIYKWSVWWQSWKGHRSIAHIHASAPNRATHHQLQQHWMSLWNSKKEIHASSVYYSFLHQLHRYLALAKKHVPVNTNKGINQRSLYQHVTLWLIHTASTEDWSSHSSALHYCWWNKGRDGQTSKSTTNE